MKKIILLLLAVGTVTTSYCIAQSEENTPPFSYSNIAQSEASSQEGIPPLTPRIVAINLKECATCNNSSVLRTKSITIHKGERLIVQVNNSDKAWNNPTMDNNYDPSNDNDIAHSVDYILSTDSWKPWNDVFSLREDNQKNTNGDAMTYNFVAKNIRGVTYITFYHYLSNTTYRYRYFEPRIKVTVK